MSDARPGPLALAIRRIKELDVQVAELEATVTVRNSRPGRFREINDIGNNLRSVVDLERLDSVSARGYNLNGATTAGWDREVMNRLRDDWLAYNGASLPKK